MRPLNIFVPHCSDLLTDYLPHGDGLVAHGLINSLALRGHRLHVAALQVKLRQPVHPNVVIYPISQMHSGVLIGRLEYMLRVRFLLERLRKYCTFDLVHQLNPVFTGVSLAIVGCNVPMVLGPYVARWPADAGRSAVRQAWSSSAMGYFRNKISALQQRNADALVLTAKAALNRIPNPSTVSRGIHLLPHGLDTDLFSPRSGWDCNEGSEESNKPSILFLANVVRRKGIFTLIEAFPAVAREIANCTLKIAGDGPELAEVKQRVARTEFAHRVKFLGRQERAKTPDLYRDCSIYCLPSFGEPYGMTAVEAMSCARALVVTDCGGLAEIVHNQGGIRVPVGDPAALSEALISLLRSPAWRIEMGRYNRRLVETTMSWHQIAEGVETIYDKVLSTRHSAQGMASARVSIATET
jgi:L-malate glycosyltransferase